MRLLQIHRIGIIGVVLAVFPHGVQAQIGPDKYAPLRAALASKKQEAIVRAEDARFWAEEYQSFLEDPEISYEEKPALRKTFIEEQSRFKNLQNQAEQLQAAINHLRQIPDSATLTLDTLKAAYDGLGDLGAQGKGAWDKLIHDRDAAIASLEEEYRRELAESVLAYEELKTAERANRILLDAIDVHRAGTTDAEFRLSLRLPPVKSAVELGFGIAPTGKDRNQQAQTTLVALIGYSQFFWDYYSGERDQLGEDAIPSDRTRNILGVPDGRVLTSDAVARNASTLYYLSDHAKEPFNGRIRAIWGVEGSVAVSWWDQKRAKNFHRACTSLSSSEEKTLVPNEQVFELLEEIDRLIDEKQKAEAAIEDIHSEFGEKLANARQFGEKAALSSAHFNAQRLARRSAQSIARFEAAHKFLGRQLAESADADWTPNVTGIAASSQDLSKIYKRLQLIREVKQELTVLLQ